MYGIKCRTWHHDPSSNSDGSLCWNGRSMDWRLRDVNVGLQGGKTFCASFCASLIAGSRRAFLCVDCVCLLLEFWVKCTRCERLLPVKHFYLTCLLFFRRLKITLDLEQPMLKEKRIIPSVWGGIKSFEHFQRGEYFSDCSFDLFVSRFRLLFAGLN